MAVSLLEEIEASVQTAVERTGPAVVGIGRGWGRGSGFVLAPGRVLTSAHNVRHDEATVTFADGRQASGRVLGSDGDLDLAVIEVETGDAPAVEWPAAAEPVPPAARCWRSPTPAAAGCVSPPGSCPPRRGASAGRAAGACRARSSTPRRCREGLRAAR